MKLLSAISLLFLSSLNARDASANFSIRGNKESELTSPEESNEEMYDLESACPVFTQNPIGNPSLTNQMLDAVKPCGYYEQSGCAQYEVIAANVDYPGEGTDDLHFRPYIVQFDIGVNRGIKHVVDTDHRDWRSRHPNKGRHSIGRHEEGEQCMEIIVQGGSDATGGCAGKCGISCNRIGGAGYAKDCLKHDVCTTYKALVQSEVDFEKADGFCYDPDCGDEAAQSVMNCYIDDSGRDTPIRCDENNFSDSRAYGFWSYAISLSGFAGPCHNFVGWDNGQGLPDKNKIRNPYEFLAFPESKGVDISRDE